MERSDLRGLPLPARLPDGYQLRTWSDGDATVVPALLGEAFGPERGTYDRLLEFWRRFPGIAADGIFIVETVDGEAVGTASARIDPSVPERGWVHLVAITARRRGSGLGRLLVGHALHYLAARGAALARVGTTETNTAALSLYVGAGFEPLIESADDRDAWRAIRGVLARPAEHGGNRALHAVDAALRRASER